MIKMYMMVTNDKYELPVVVAPTLTGLAKAVGQNKGNVYNQIKRHQRGSIPHGKYKYEEVIMEED